MEGRMAAVGQLRIVRIGENIRTWAHRLFLTVGALGMLAIMVGSFTDAIARRASAGSFGGVQEVMTILLVVITGAGLAPAQRRGNHVSTTILAERLPARVSAVVRALGLLVCLVFVAWLSIALLQDAVTSTRVGEYAFGTYRVPIWPGRLALAVGFMALSVELLLQIFMLAVAATTPNGGVGTGGRAPERQGSLIV